MSGDGVAVDGEGCSIVRTPTPKGSGVIAPTCSAVNAPMIAASAAAFARKDARRSSRDLATMFKAGGSIAPAMPRQKASLCCSMAASQ